jgi:D-alanyl-lipoteichoic acid acyltransferase DltB (MBOAT superfamily)
MAFIPKYIFILILTIVVDYFAGIWIENSIGRKRKIYLIVSIISTCLILFVFKYYNFFNTNFENLAKFLGWNYSISTLKIILPIGLSFHTFQSLSYVIEVYRGNQKAEKHFGIYSLYVMFYPQLVAGPIERPQNLLHQFYEKHNLDGPRIISGLKLMAWGLFKKVVIADRLSVFVNQVYNSPTQFEGISLMIATIFFAYQIYCDFSGYSDIAIGSARVMGFNLMLNFNRPYYSKSISEFWRRWHISLSTWFKDYVYISMGGNRVSKWRNFYNLFITFLISGFWHGANWTFVAWGALHGIFLIIGAQTKDNWNSLLIYFRLPKESFFGKFVRVICTFTLVCVGWVFFRAANISDAFYILKNSITGITNVLSVFTQERKHILYLDNTIYEFSLALIAILLLEMVHLKQRSGNFQAYVSALPTFVKWSGYVVGLLLIIFFGKYGSQDFIYFQF